MNDSTPIQPFPELTEKVEQLTAEVNRLKKAREALLAQNNLLDSLFEHVLMGMTVWDTQGRLLYANQGFTRLTGYSRTDIRTLDDWFPRAYPDAEYRAAVMAEWAASTALTNAVRTFAVTCKDGQVKTVEFRASFLANGRALVTLTDVTDMHRTKAALQKQTDRYQAFSNAAFEAMFVSVDGRCVDANQAAQKMFGYRREELVGIFGTDVIAPESKARVRENMLSGYEDPYEAVAQRKDGTRFHVEIRGQMTEHHGRQVRITVVHDIDQHKRAEKELKASESLLKSIFSSAPVGIGMVVDRVIRKANERLCEMTGYTQSELIGRGARMLYPTDADLTRQLLGFARGGKYEVRPVDLNHLVADSARMFGRTHKEIRIQTAFDPDLRAVEVDPGQIEQVLLNLYVNAWQAMPAGGDLYLKTANVSFAPEDIRPADLTPGNYVKVAVTDTGSGMDAATRDRIFEPFFTTREMGRGTGLGLASVFGILRNHAGQITVYSEKGRGTTFNIYLPASEKSVSSRQRSLRTISVPARKPSCWWTTKK
jgi:two-component system cell cycle sensor histidine kinase/response regulator CckA